MKNILLLVGALVFSSAATALPLPKAGLVPPASLMQDFNFEGIVGLSNCSGSLIRLEGAPDSDHGLILTNGHCLGSFMDPGEFKTHEPSSRSFSLYDADANSVGRLHATEIWYATMTNTDMAVYKLEETYAEIKSEYGVEALTLASEQAPVNTPIEVVSGYWERGYRCSIEAYIPHLKEAEWTWNDSLRYSRPGCEVIGGTSGSPVIQSGTRTVVGVNNTTNESGYECTMNNPCEIDENGNIFYREGYGYAQQTHWLYACLNAATRELDLNKADCLLTH